MREYIEQYRDQIAVIGEEGQLRLHRSRVHIAGLGGIGSHVALDLADAGVGYLTANDPQVLELSNLSRWPLGSVADLGRAKVDVYRSFFANRASIRLEAIQAPTESRAVHPLLRADLVICCSNTQSSRVAALQAAIRWNRPLLDVGVADGRHTLAGTVRVFNPRQKRYACPACFTTHVHRVSRGEGLLSTVVASTASFAAHMAMEFLSSGAGLDRWGNVITLDFERLTIEQMRVLKGPDCPVCSRRMATSKAVGASLHGSSK